MTILICHSGVIMSTAVLECEASRDALPVCLWQENPNRLVSLWDIMQLFSVEDCCSIFSFFGKFEQHATLLAGSLREVPPYLKIEALEVLLRAEKFCRKNVLVESQECASRLLGERWPNHPSSEDSKKIQFDELQMNLKHLRELMESEMRKQLFFGMTKDLSDYYKKERPMGDEVYNAFPTARFDVSEAGTCLACSCNVAAAFHLMRATEVGLWELGRDRQIPLARSGKIEFSEWGLIIGELEESIKKIQQWPNSRTKEDAHKFYIHVLFQIRAFNDGWRRHTAHVRPAQPEMKAKEAFGLWEHVSSCFTTLSTKISEGKYTSLEW
jgi:hypothetical protein